VTTLDSLFQNTPKFSPVVVTWSYSPSGDQTGFTIERATNAGFTQGVTTFNVGPDLRTYSDGPIKKAGIYYYRVVATNALGNGAWSNVLSIDAHM